MFISILLRRIPPPPVALRLVYWLTILKMSNSVPDGMDKKYNTAHMAIDYALVLEPTRLSKCLLVIVESVTAVRINLNRPSQDEPQMGGCVRIGGKPEMAVVPAPKTWKDSGKRPK